MVSVKNKKTVLIGEDELPLAKALTFKFENKGYTVIAVKDGAEVIDNLDKGGIDVLLLDLMMPNVNGFEVLEHITKKKMKLPVYVSSNLGQTEDREKAQKHNIKDFFVKSDTSLNDIIDTVEKELKK